jgi:DNA-directed RNA polymerase specialized sigma24 family protein
MTTSPAPRTPDDPSDITPEGGPRMESHPAPLDPDTIRFIRLVHEAAIDDPIGGRAIEKATELLALACEQHLERCADHRRVDIDDLRSDAFEKAWDAVVKMAAGTRQVPRRSLASYAGGIVDKAALSIVRHLGVQRRLRDSLEGIELMRGSLHYGVDSTVADRLEIQMVLHRASQRDARFMLMPEFGFSDEEIGRIVGGEKPLTPNNVGVRRHAARKRAAEGREGQDGGRR